MFYDNLSTAIGATLYMLCLGTPYAIGAISPYLASYFQIDITQV